MISILNGAIKMHEVDGVKNPSQDGIWLAERLNFSNSTQNVLDVGCGTGVISLCAKYLYPNINITAIDINKQLVDIAKKNAKLNGFDVNFIQQDIFNNSLKENYYDAVFSNPPFHRVDKGFFSIKNNTAFAATKDEIKSWILSMLKLVKNGGRVCLIHHSQNTDIISELNKDYKLSISPLQTCKHKPAKRVWVCIEKV